MATSINELPISSGGDRVVTRHLPSNPEVVVRYPRPALKIGADEQFRLASFMKKSFAHLGFSNSALETFVSGLRKTANDEATAKSDPCAGKTVEIDGKTYTLTPA